MIINADGEIQLRAGCIGGPRNYDTNRVSDETGLYCPEETKAQQHFAEECDINTIVKRFGLTGELPIHQRTPLDADLFVEQVDYHQALSAINHAEQAFMDLPADVRSKFDNDPGNLIRFLDDPENRGRAEEMGIVIKRQAAEPPKDTTAPPPAA